MDSWRVDLVSGSYKVRGVRIVVSLNGSGSWATNSARTDAALLRHEQGHYDITGLIARDLAANVLDLSLDAVVVAAMKDAGTSASQHMQYAQKQFQKSIAEFGQQASELLNRLQTNPTTQSDGLYDAQTNHGKNQPAQTIWNNRLSQIKLGDTSFRLALAMAGVM